MIRRTLSVRETRAFGEGCLNDESSVKIERVSWRTVLMISRFEASARMAWTIGNENLPSVKSSQNPLLVAYCWKSVSDLRGEKERGGTDLGGLEIDVVVANLEDDSNQVGEGDVVPRTSQHQPLTSRMGRGEAYLGGFSGEAAIINLIAMRNNPPVSVPTAMVNTTPLREDRDDLTVVDHLNVLWFCWTDEVLPPVQIHSLTPV